MSEDKTRFDQDIELAKINVASQYKTQNYFTMVAFILAAFLAFLLLYYQGTTVHDSLGYFAGLSIIAGLFMVLVYFSQIRPFDRYMRYLNDAIKEIENGHRIGDLRDVIKAKKQSDT